MLRVLLLPLLLPVAYAHCPVCTAAVGAGTAAARLFGVDDVIVGLWFGALIVAAASMAVRGKKYSPVIPLLTLVLTVYSLYLAGLLGDPGNTIFGVDRLTVGMFVGGLLTAFTPYLSLTLTKLTGRYLVPHQTTALTVILLVLLTLLCYLLP